MRVEHRSCKPLQGSVVPLKDLKRESGNSREGQKGASLAEERSPFWCQ